MIKMYLILVFEVLNCWVEVIRFHVVLFEPIIQIFSVILGWQILKSISRNSSSHFSNFNLTNGHDKCSSLTSLTSPVGYFDQLLGAAHTRKQVKTLFKMAAMPIPCNVLLLYCVNIPTVLLMFLNKFARCTIPFTNQLGHFQTILAIKINDLNLS